MTAKEYVKSKYPNARVERQIAFAPLRKIIYWTVKSNDILLGAGATQSSAWVESKNNLNPKIKDK